MKTGIYVVEIDRDGHRLHVEAVPNSSRRPKTRSARLTGAPTMGDVAARAGVSKMSVSRFLRDPQKVAEPLRSRIEQAIAQLNYVPNRAAQILSGASAPKIGLLYNYPRSAYAVDLLMGAVDQAAALNVQLLIRGCRFSVDDDATLRDVLDQHVDAVILTAPLCESAPLMEILREAGVPAMLVGTGLLPAAGCAMHIDEFAAAYDMTRHIVGLGHKRIGFIEGGRALTATGQRLAGYRAALTDAGLDADDGIVVPGLFTYRSGLEAANRLLSMADRPTAIFASNDDMAAATVATAHRLGLDVPLDVTICGFDDSWIATNIWPELTTVRQPVCSMGAQAVSIACAMAQTSTAAGHPPASTLFPHRIMVRHSDGPAPDATIAASGAGRGAAGLSFRPPPGTR